MGACGAFTSLGRPLQGGCKCIVLIVKSIGAYHHVRYEVGVRYWEYPL